MTNCMHCGKLVDPNLDNCPYCGGFLRSRTPAPAAAPAAQGRSQTCPNCRALVQAGDIICVACGTNLLTGQKIADTRTAAPPPTKSGGSWRTAAAAVAAVIVLAIAAAAVYILTRDPVDAALRQAAAGQTLQAVEALRAHVQRNPNDVRGRYELGRLLWKTDNLAEAANAFEWVAQNAPDRRDAVMLAAAALAAQDGPAPAARLVELLDKWVAVHADDAQAWTLLAAGYEAQDNAPKQAEALARVAQLQPENAAAREALALASALSGDYAAAAQSLTAVAAGGAAPAAQAALGVVQHLAGDANAAKTNLQQALENNPPAAADLRTQLALLHMHDGEFDQALAQLNGALGVDPNHEAANYFRAVCYKVLGLRPEAIGALRQIAEAEGLFAGQASLAYADLLLANSEVDAATVALDRAERLGAAGAPLFTLRGRVLVAGGDMNGAQTYFDRATGADPAYAPAHLEKGLAYVQRNLPDQGVRSLEQYLQLVNPALPDARVNEIRTLVDQLKRTTGAAA